MSELIRRVASGLAVAALTACTQPGGVPYAGALAPADVSSNAASTPTLYALTGAASPLIAGYPYSSNGPTSPKNVIRGTTAELPTGTGGVAVAADGSTYVLDGANARLLAFAPGASGDDAPLRSAALPTSTYNDLALDASGLLWTEDTVSGTLEAYAPSATGNVKPSLEIQPQLRTPNGLLPAYPVGVTTSARGDVYCACVVLYHGAQAIGVSQYRVLPSGKIRLVKSFYDFAMPEIPPESIAVDPASGTIYLGSTRFGAPRIFAYPATTGSGEVHVKRVIVGRATTLGKFSAIAVGPNGTLYVADGKHVTVFSAGAHGDAAPIRRFGDPAHIQFTPGVFGSFLSFHG